MRKFLFGSVTVLGAAGLARAQSYTASAITPLQNAFVSANNPNSNYGAAGALEVSGSNASNPHGLFQAYLEFNLSSTKSAITSNLGANWTVSSITLQLNGMTPGNNGVFQANVSGTFGIEWIDDNSWTEGTGTPAAPSMTGINYNTQPSASDDALVGTFTYSGSTGLATYTLPVIGGELGDIENGSDMTLEVFPNSSSMSYLFNSNQFTNSADFPMLTVTAMVPEPASVGLILGSSLLLMRRTRATASVRSPEAARR